MTLRSESAVRIPTGISAAEYAPILCAGITTFNSIRQMNIAPGSLVAVQGLGGLGHLAIQYANKAGFRVAALSRDASKEQFARKLGAHEYVDGSKVNQHEALQKMGGASLIIATAPNANGISPLLKGLGVMGKLLVLTVVGELPVDTIAMVSLLRSLVRSHFGFVAANLMPLKDGQGTVCPLLALGPCH